MAILIPQVITLIMGEYKISEAQATEFFYSSELYSVLEDEPTKLWHLSPHALFDLFQEEQHTGKITYPEEV
jgi:hypothetical protein